MFIKLKSFYRLNDALYLCIKHTLLLTITITFFAAIGIQIVFLLAFLIAFARKREQPNFTAPVSLVICAHDELENLKELIPLLLAQNHSHFEVIIVDDRSNDATFDFLLEETKKDTRLRMVHINRLPEHVDGKKYALTLGIKAARNEWILLTDADCRPENSQWLTSLSSHFAEQTTFVLGYSPYLVQPGFLNKFIRFESFITAIQYIGLALLKIPYMGVGRNLAYRKSYFLESKGFNHLMHITGGDDDLFVNQHANANNTVVSLGVDSLVHSHPKKTLKSFFYQKVRHLSVGKKYKFKHKALLGIFSITWVLSWLGGIYMLIIFIPIYLVAVALAFRALLLILVTQIAVKQLGQKFGALPIVFLDFLYCIYYISTGLVALLTKKVQWRN